MKEYIVVGAGITGAIIARHFAEKGCKVTVFDRRNTIAGNLYDEKMAMAFFFRSMDLIYFTPMTVMFGTM